MSLHSHCKNIIDFISSNPGFLGESFTFKCNVSNKGTYSTNVRHNLKEFQHRQPSPISHRKHTPKSAIMLVIKMPRICQAQEVCCTRDVESHVYSSGQFCPSLG